MSVRLVTNKTYSISSIRVIQGFFGLRAPRSFGRTGAIGVLSRSFGAFLPFFRVYFHNFGVDLRGVLVARFRQSVEHTVKNVLQILSGLLLHLHGVEMTSLNQVFGGAIDA